MGESLLQELKSPLTEPVPKVVEFRPADWPEKYYSGQSARSSSQLTLSPSYTKQFSSLIGLTMGRLLWRVSEKKFNKAEEIAGLNIGARNQYSSINFLGGFI